MKNHARDALRLAPMLALILMLAMPIFAQQEGQEPSPGASMFLGAGKCFAVGEEQFQLNPITNFDAPIKMAIAMVILLIAISYMVGEATSKHELVVFAKSEAITLMFSIALMFMVVGAFTASCTISQAMTKNAGNGVGPAVVASEYFDGLIERFGSDIAINLVQSSINDQFNSMPYAYWGFPWDPGGGGGTGYKANQRAWSAHKEMLASLYVPVIASIKAQKILLEALYLGVVAVLLPAAILLRFIFFTRDMGNFLLAFCFALYFFMPLTLVYAQQATDEVVKAMGGTSTNPFLKLETAKDRVVGDAYQRIGFLAIQAVLIPNLALVIMATAVMGLYKAFKGFVA